MESIIKSQEIDVSGDEPRHGDVVVEPGDARWVMRGEIDAAVQSRVEPTLLASLARVEGELVVDLSAVTFLDSGGLRLLYVAAGTLTSAPVLVGTPPNVRDLLELSGVAPLFDVRD